MNHTPLECLQQWMQDAIQHPWGAAAAAQDAAPLTPADLTPATIDDVIARSRQLSAAARLEIYQHAYFARLVECLESEFPAVRFAAGPEAFAGLALGYLHAWPSRSDTLASLGAHFAEYLLATRPPRDENDSPPDFADLLIDLARLERTYSEVFDGPGPERTPGLEFAALAELSAEEFATSKIKFHDSVRLLTLQFPCHEFASAVRQERDPIPLAPAPTQLVVYRREYVVRRMSVAPRQFELLCRLHDGATVGDALAQAARQVENLQELTAEVRAWFGEWARAQLFREVVR
jgi:hypothetical protein